MKVEKILQKELTKAGELTWLQNKVCEWFKIPKPEQEYFVKLIIGIDNIGDVRVGDFVVGKNTWRVLHINDSETNVTISSAGPISDYEEHYLKLTFRAFAE